MATDIILRIVFLVILFVFPFGQILRISLDRYWPGLRIQPIDFFVFLFLAFWFIDKVYFKKRIFLPSIFKLMGAFIFLAAVSLFLRFSSLDLSEFIVSFLYFLRIFTYISFFLALTSFFITENINLKKILVFEGGAVAFGALLQYLFLPDARFLLNLGWDEHYFRAIGTFLDPGFTGLILVLSFLSLLVLFLEEKKNRIFYFFFGIFLLLTLGLTFSRGAYLSLLIGSGAIFFFQKKIKPFIFIFLFFLTVVFFTPKPGGEGVNLLRKTSVVARLNNYRQALLIIKDHFLFGVGFNAYRFAQRDYGFANNKDWYSNNAGAGVDNSFLLTMSTTGIFGLIIFLVIWLKILFEACPKKENKSGLLLFSSVFTILFASFYINALFYPWILFWIILLLADFTAGNKESTQLHFYSEQDQRR